MKLLLALVLIACAIVYPNLSFAYPSDAELNRRIRNSELAEEQRSENAIRAIIQKSDEELQQNQGRSYWSDSQVVELRKRMPRNFSQIWQQAKQDRNGRWIRGSSGNISYSDGGFFCRHGISKGRIPWPYYECFNMDGSSVYSSH